MAARNRESPTSMAILSELVAAIMDAHLPPPAITV
jgi:hypothetical protein